MKETFSELWEVLVPAADNNGNVFDVAHHNIWDEEVRRLAGGLTIMRTAKGQWEDSHGNLFAEKVIPVRIACDKDTIRLIMERTLRHYGQLAIMAYRISDQVLILESE